MNHTTKVDRSTPGASNQLPISNSNDNASNTARKSIGSNLNASSQHSFMLLKIKVLSNLCRDKLQDIGQIKDGWEVDDDEEDFAKWRLEIGVHLDYTILTFEELVSMSEQQLNSPPAYNGPDEQHNRQLELLVLSKQAHEYAAELIRLLEHLGDETSDALGSRVEEALVRARMVNKEADGIVDAARLLSSAE